MNKVAVLMSTYNGEKYLREQIDSILSQEGVEVTLFIRDDGSSDSTIQIIEEYIKVHAHFKLTKGENVGVGNSFMQLVYEAGNDFDYYAFADQDDVWLPQKIERAIEKIGNKTVPILYCSNQVVVDKNLNQIGMRYGTDPNVDYMQIMCQNQITGCTMVWNSILYTILTEKNRRPSEKLLKNRIHDVWIAMISSVIGNIIYDPNGYILYRQHEDNVVGVKKNCILKEWLKKLIDMEQRNGRSLLCGEVYYNYKDIIEEERILEALNLYGNYRKDLNFKKQLLINCSDITAITGENRIGFRLKVLLGFF